MAVILGRLYGLLTPVCRTTHSYYLCHCACGNLFVRIRASNLTSGNTRSCGCLRRCRKDLSRSSTYVTWAAMRRRCSDRSHPRWGDYGGRGITVCAEWADLVKGFERFVQDMGMRPEGRTLDRIDTNGIYEKANCKWSTLQEQRWNRRDMVKKVVEDDLREWEAGEQAEKEAAESEAVAVAHLVEYVAAEYLVERPS